jgi:hypothetical protein
MTNNNGSSLKASIFFNLFIIYFGSFCLA